MSCPRSADHGRRVNGQGLLFEAASGCGRRLTGGQLWTALEWLSQLPSPMRSHQCARLTRVMSAARADGLTERGCLRGR